MGLASDVAGTSYIVTLIAEAPLLDAEVCNVATIEGHWGPFVPRESGGVAMARTAPEGPRDLIGAVGAFVRYADEVVPDPA